MEKCGPFMEELGLRIVIKALETEDWAQTENKAH